MTDSFANNIFLLPREVLNSKCLTTNSTLFTAELESVPIAINKTV